MSRPENSFWTLLEPQKVKNDPKIKSKSNVRIERNIENESCSTTWVELRTFFEPFPNSKNSPLGPKKSKMTPKLSQNQMSELKETKNTHDWNNDKPYEGDLQILNWK